MIDYGSFQFASPPRTGVRWFLNCAAAAGCGLSIFGDAYKPFFGNHKAIKVSLVIHPYTWLYRVYSGVKKRNIDASQLGKFCIAEELKSFEDFSQWYLNHNKGGITKLFSKYKSDTVFRFEDMPWPLGEFFESLEIPSESIQLAMNIPHQHSSTPNDRNLKTQVVRAEWDFCERYEYY